MAGRLKVGIRGILDARPLLNSHRPLSRFSQSGVCRILFIARKLIVIPHSSDGLLYFLASTRTDRGGGWDVDISTLMRATGRSLQGQSTRNQRMRASLVGWTPRICALNGVFLGEPINEFQGHSLQSGAASVSNLRLRMPDHFRVLDALLDGLRYLAPVRPGQTLCLRDDGQRRKPHELSSTAYCRS